MSLINGLKKSGITSLTPTSLLLGAGTIYKNLTWNTQNSIWSGTILGATSGGSKLTIAPNIVDIEIDGACVKTKGLVQKQGETGTIEVNLVEITPESLKMAIIGATAESDATGFDKVVTKAVIEDSDYLTNIAFVGFLANNKPIVIIMENALCTSGLELSGKNKENTVIPVTFECYAAFDENTSQDVLPISIYYPSASANSGSGAGEGASGSDVNDTPAEG